MEGNIDKKLRLRGAAKGYSQFVIISAFMLLVVNIGIYFVSVEAAIILNFFLILYFILCIWYLFSTKRAAISDCVKFASEYAQMQKLLLKELDVPYALVDSNNHIMWGNDRFKDITSFTKHSSKTLTSYFSELGKDKMPSNLEVEQVEFEVSYNEREYKCIVKKFVITEMINSSKMFAIEGEGVLNAVYLYDETALKYALKEVDDQEVSVGLIYLDNYEEALESVEEVRRSLLTALIERKLNKYISSVDGICKRLEKDKYLIILKKKSLRQLQEVKFDILEDIKTVNIGNEMSVTMSFGIGYEGMSYAQNFEYARIAIGVALGRGGDQAVVKNSNQTLYYGGKSQQVEKNTRVKARVKAHALKEIIDSKENVIIMGHRNPDVDCLGAAVGVYRIAKLCDKKAHIVLNDTSGNLQPLIEKLQANTAEHEADMLLHPRDVESYVTNDTVLVVVDVNKPSITENPDLLKLCKSIVVFDHHRQGDEIIENATLSYIEPYASSTCEMVTEILQYTSEQIKIPSEEADSLYAGMVVDTDNFLTKTGVRTFEAAAFLRRSGADVIRVRKLFRENAIDYKTRADVVSQAEIYKDRFAISFCNTEDIPNATIIGAQAANELLNIRGVQASFVLTPHQGKIFISARSIDEVNVQIIMEKLGGGGHLGIAACQLTEVTLVEAEGILKNTLLTMMENGEL